MNLKGKRVFVGLSGGVDSSVTAALLQKAGADVTGVFIKGWYPPGMPCTWADDRRDAMRVAAHLGIPFHTLEAVEEYKTGVIDYLLAEYKAGRTPNPDIMCNREVKFGAFYRFAKEHHADFIATGHYARAKHLIEGEPQLLRGADESKDQSYFLWAVPAEALAHTLFPLGEMQKSDVRTIAHKLHLPVADKKDSQGICFLGSISVEEFLQKEFHPAEGAAVTSDGKEVGRHDGAVLYTLGARIALHDAPPGPWYVVKKDMRTNTLTVSNDLHTIPEQQSLTLESPNWFATPSGDIEVQYRYHGPRVIGKIKNATFTPHNPFVEPIASGQSLVVYHGEQCLGGGIIA